MTGAGSYALDNMARPDDEVARLERQARVAIELERHVWRRAGLKPGMRVLDLACGTGIISEALAETVAPAQVVGCDLSPQLLAQASQRCQDNLRFVQADVYALPFEDNSFDFVYARFLFQHLDVPEAAAASIHRVLAPGGIACLVDVDDQWLMVHPEPRVWKPFLSAAADGQRANGGNRHVGRALSGYLGEAGLRGCKTFIQAITSDDIGLNAFLDITTRFKVEQMPDKDTAVRQLQEIDSTAQFGAVGVFVATGQKDG